jgi:hypothetical protein
MTDDLLTQLQASNPIETSGASELLEVFDRDVQLRRILDESRVRPPRRGSAPRLGIATAAVFAACIALVILFSGRTGERGHISQAVAARAYRAVNAPTGIYHFVSIARLSVPRDYVAAGGGYSGPFFYRPYAYWNVTTRNGRGPSLFLSINRDHYEEDWLTLDNTRSRARTFALVDGRRGRMLHELTTDPKQVWSYTPRNNRLILSTPRGGYGGPAFPDPVTAFRQAYEAQSVRLVGEATLRGRRVWRLEDRSSWRQLGYPATRVITWFVDRRTYLPIEVRYREPAFLVGAKRPIGEMAVRIRFLKFQLLPLNASTHKLLSPSRKSGVRLVHDCGQGYTCTPAQSRRWHAFLHDLISARKRKGD